MSSSLRHSIRSSVRWVGCVRTRMCMCHGEGLEGTRCMLASGHHALHHGSAVVESPHLKYFSIVLFCCHQHHSIVIKKNKRQAEKKSCCGSGVIMCWTMQEHSWRTIWHHFAGGLGSDDGRTWMAGPEWRIQKSSASWQVRVERKL